MNEFVFAPSEWEQALDEIPAGGSLCAARFLTLIEGEEEAEVEAALQELERRQIVLDVTRLPKIHGVGEAAVRLRREEQLAQSGKLLEGLEETDPLRLYLEELARLPACGVISQLAVRLAEGDESAIEPVTSLMLGRVVQRACELVGRGVLLLDLIQEGSLSLWQGILNYTGGDLEAYCDRCIQAGMAKAVTLQAHSNGVGQRLRQAMEDYRSVDERLLAELGRNPTLEEIAQELHMSVQEATAVAKTVESARTLAQAKQPQPEQDDPEEQQAVEDTAYFQTRQRISELLSGLEEQEAKLLTLRFGLEGGKPLTPQEVGRKLGLTPEEAVAAEARALSKLRQNESLDTQ